MRTLRLAEKQNNLKSLLQTIEPGQNCKYSLPIISEKNQNSSKNHSIAYSCQGTPKIFINSEEALIWIKKDVDRKTRHDFIEMIKKRAEQQISISKNSSLPQPMLENRYKRNYNTQTVRKYSSTSRCQKMVQKSAREAFNLIDRYEKNHRKKTKQDPNSFLSIRVVEVSAAPFSKSNNKDRIQTQKNSRHSNKNIDMNQASAIKSNSKQKSEGKFNIKKFEILDSYDNEYLSPW